MLVKECNDHIGKLECKKTLKFIIPQCNQKRMNVRSMWHCIIFLMRFRRFYIYTVISYNLLSEVTEAGIRFFNCIFIYVSVDMR